MPFKPLCQSPESAPQAVRQSLGPSLGGGAGLHGRGGALMPQPALSLPVTLPRSCGQGSPLSPTTQHTAVLIAPDRPAPPHTGRHTSWPCRWLPFLRPTFLCLPLVHGSSRGFPALGPPEAAGLPAPPVFTASRCAVDAGLQEARTLHKPESRQTAHSSASHARPHLRPFSTQGPAQGSGL